MGSAIIALVGGVIGALLTSMLHSRQENRRARLRSRTAARLLLECFEETRRALDFTQRMFGETVQADQPAPLFVADFEVPEWTETRVIFAERLDSDAFAALASGVKIISRLSEYASQFETTRGTGGTLLRMSDVDVYRLRLGRPIALLSILADDDLRSPPIRMWTKWRDKPRLTDVARDRFVLSELGVDPQRDHATA